MHTYKNYERFHEARPWPCLCFIKHVYDMYDMKWIKYKLIAAVSLRMWPEYDLCHG